MTQAFRWVLVPALVLAPAFGCGGGALESTPQSPAPKSGSVSDLDALEQELSANEQRLFASLEQRRAHFAQPPSQAPAPIGEGQAEAPGTPPSTGAAPAEEPPPAPAPPSDASADKGGGGTATESQAGPRSATPCEIACRAFSSMRRSAARICELAGEGDDQCARARDRVQRAREQLSAARCPCPEQH